MEGFYTCISCLQQATTLSFNLKTRCVCVSRSASLTLLNPGLTRLICIEISFIIMDELSSNALGWRTGTGRATVHYMDRTLQTPRMANCTPKPASPPFIQSCMNSVYISVSLSLAFSLGGRRVFLCCRPTRPK